MVEDVAINMAVWARGEKMGCSRKFLQPPEPSYQLKVKRANPKTSGRSAHVATSAFIQRRSNTMNTGEEDTCKALVSNCRHDYSAAVSAVQGVLRDSEGVDDAVPLPCRCPAVRKKYRSRRGRSAHGWWSSQTSEFHGLALVSVLRMPLWQPQKESVRLAAR